MHIYSLATVLLAASISGALARGGQQTWILVCEKSRPQSECNLTTASRWYHLPSPQVSSATPAINAAKAQVGREIDGNYYLHVEQFPAGVSMGSRGLVFRACELMGPVASDAEEIEWARRGSCLR